MATHRDDVDFDVVLTPDPDGGYAVSVPTLPGCFSQGADRDEALRNIREAIEGYLDIFGIPEPPVVVDRVSVPA